MLDKLVESKDTEQEDKKVRRLFLATSTIITSVAVFALVFSLFSQSLALGQDNIDLSSLISPMPIAEDRPTPPEPKKNSQKSAEKVSESEVPTRTANILRLEETPTEVPQTISTTPSSEKARPDSYFEIGKINTDPPPAFSNSENNRSSSNDIGVTFTDRSPSNNPVNEKPEITDVPKPPPPPVKKKNTIVSGGVVNGKAVRLVMPVYPAAAKSVQLRGQVTVQVLIDEDGNVVSAQAIKGHQLFVNHAVKAARQSTFTPTTLSGEKVKVRGLIVYNFN